ncbi:MAG: SGNH/GDSL hydrolase family protein [Eubacteriales bacterium]|nr:SGNH/GDSL hydrolase family protein [Eubacteriales bacterium]
MSMQDKKIIFLGDSITAGVGASCVDKRYESLVTKALGCKTLNYGISATRIANQKGEPMYGPSYSQRFSQMEDGADIVFVFGGTNDYGHGDAPIGTPEDKTPDTFYGACDYLFSGLIKKYPNALIAIMTPMHREGENVPNKNGAILKTYVDIIRNTAEKYSLPVLDLWKNLGIYPDIAQSKAALTADGLHPNDAGHRMIAERVLGFLFSMGYDVGNVEI